MCFHWQNLQQLPENKTLSLWFRWSDSGRLGQIFRGRRPHGAASKRGREERGGGCGCRGWGWGRRGWGWRGASKSQGWIITNPTTSDKVKRHSAVRTKILFKYNLSKVGRSKGKWPLIKKIICWICEEQGEKRG